MKHHYALEKLDSAVHSLETDRGDLRTRLWNAYMFLHTLSEKDFADEYKEDWNFIYRSLTRELPTYDDRGEVPTGRVQNTLRILGEDTCLEIAESISKLASRLRRN